jgi:hypothetical protein
VDGAEAGGGEGGEDAGVCGDAFREALATPQTGGDQVEGVAAVDLGAGRTAGRAAVVAADQEVTGREGGGVEAVEDVADLSGAGVDVVFGAVAVEADRRRAAAESGELAEDTGQGAVLGELGEFGQWGRGGAGEDGVLLLAGLLRWSGGMSPGAADAWPCRTAPGHQAPFSAGGGRGASSAGPRRRWRPIWP